MRCWLLRSVALGWLASGLLAQALPDLVVERINTAQMNTDSQTLGVSGRLDIAIRNQGTGPANGSVSVVAFEDRNANGRLDSGVDFILGAGTLTGPVAVGASLPLLVSVSGNVQFRGNLIYVVVDSTGAVAESDEGNNSRNTGLNSQSASGPTTFSPALKWSWTASATQPTAINVMNTPAVADVNADGIPEVIFGSTAETGGNFFLGGYLRAIDGRTGAAVFTSTTPINTASSVAVGDIDGDGRPEIVACGVSADRLLAFEHDGTLKWTSGIIEPCYWGAPTLADLNGDGTPEIIMGRQVLSATGQILWTGTGGVGASQYGAGNLGGLTYAADVDLDGQPDVVAGNTVYSGAGAIRYRNAALPDGLTAVGNFDSDTQAEIVLVSGGRVWLLEHDLSIKWGPIALPGGGGGGPPTVADFDNDGQPEIGVAGATRYVVIETNGTVKWQTAVQDSSSNVTGSSVFDFEGDGASEVVYGDELRLYVLRGSDGTVLFQTPKSSCTWHEYPLVADVDSDGSADIVSVANQNCGFGTQRGVFVFHDPGRAWVRTRPLWNQFSYSITNVNDNLTIPRNPTPNWLSPGLNNFRLNTFTQAGQATTAPDLTSSFIRSNASSFPASVQLTARIGNGGSVAPSGSAGSNLLRNPSFEEGCPAVASRLDPPSTSIPGWTVVKGQVDWNGSVYPSFEGRCSMNLEGDIFAVGGVEQSFVTIPGQTYEVTFRLHADPVGGPATSPMRVSAAGSQADFTAVKTISPIVFVQHSWRFTAAATTTALRFESMNSSTVAGYGPVIDAVEVRGLASTAFGSDLLVNGDFEACLPACGNLHSLNPGVSPLLPGWTVINGQIDLKCPFWQVISGVCNLDLGGSPGVGGIEQAIATVPGKRYQVSFLMAGNYFASPVIKQMRVTAGPVNQMFSFDVTGNSPSNLGWVERSMEFVANSTSTIIRFENIDTSAFPAYGPTLDRVKVREIIATSSQPTNVSFYRGDPASGGTLIGRTRTTRPLAPGEFEDVTVTWTNPPVGLHQIYAVADDPAEITEGDETNNKAAALILLGAGPFPLVDDLLTRQKDRSIDLSWSAIPGATSYSVYRRTGTGTLTRVATNTTNRAFSDVSLTNGTRYSYLVRWNNAQGVESADGTEASATPTPAGATGANPPTILSRPLTRAVVGLPYAYAFRAADPDAGTSLTYTLLSAPTGMTINAAGAIAWTPTVAQAGYTRVRVQVADNTNRSAFQEYSLFADVPVAVNQPPVITSSPNLNGASGETYVYSASGRDPENGLLTWSLLTAPAGMTLNAATGLLQWTPTRAQLGPQSVTLRLTDIGGLFATQIFSINVARGNRAPVFTSSALLTARALSPYAYQATATDPETDPLTFGLVSGPTGMTVSAAGLVTWTPPAGAANTTVPVTLRVSDDGGLFATQSFSLSVGTQNLPPTITSTAILTASVNALYAYQVTATDPNLPSDALTYSLTTAPTGMSISPTGLIQWTPTATGPAPVAVRVVDQGGLAATQTFTVTVAPPDTTRPTVSLLTPASGATLNIDAPVTGAVNDDNLRLWRVEYRRPDDATWLTLSTGTTNVTSGGQLGIFPATLLANDVYRMRLYAEDAGGGVYSPEIEIQVNTQQLKLGDFTLSFEDMRIPGFTFPISILRKYDTKRTRTGEFGRAWELAFNEVEVRLDVNKHAYLTLPDGRRVGFNYTPECTSPLFGACAFGVFNTVYTAQSGVYDKLQNLDCPQTIAGGCSLGGPFNPSSWLLTTRDGVKYTITGNRLVTRMEDRTGNFLAIGASGITSNFGRNVTFERDGSNRITRIVEPNSAATRYEYDAEGRLVRFINQAGQITNYAYANAAFPHYLTAITDASGRVVLRNVFGADGRLTAQCDANGDIATLAGCVRFDNLPTGRQFNAINARGFKTELFLDERGNVLTERRYTDATNFLATVRTYDASNNLLTETDPAGAVKRFTYDTRGNRLTEVDPGGRTTTYTYDATCNKVLTQRDPAGNTTTYTYDTQCNLRFVRDALNNTTEYRYNAAGQRTHFVDPMGSTWTWAYAANGLLTSLTDPFGKSTTFTFNTSGDLLTRIDRMNRRIDFTYDAAHRVLTERWGNGRLITFAYDSTGLLTSAVDPDSSLTMTYDTLGRLRTVDNAGTPGAPRVLMTYGYDPNGNVASVADSLGGITEYAYDGLDRLSRVQQSGINVQQKRVDMEYDASSLLRTMRRFSNLAGTAGVANTLYEYDCPGCPSRLSAIRHRKASDNTIIQDLAFSRDALGNITNMTDAEGSHTYTYDAIRRLLSAAHSNPALQPNEFYAYDGAANRLSSHLSALHAYAKNRLVEDQKYSYLYDDQGNQTRRTTKATGGYTEYAYDHRNRISFVTERTSVGAEVSRESYVYDLGNRLISSTRAGQTSFTVFDRQNPALVLASSGTTISRRLYTSTVDGLLAMESSDATRWPMRDQVGSVRGALSATGVPETATVYDSFGRILLNTESSSDLLWAGRPSRSGRAEMRARHLDTEAGRFTQEDLLSPFSYEYASSCPVSNVDPLGLFSLGSYGLLLNVSAPFIGTLAANCLQNATYGDRLTVSSGITAVLGGIGAYLALSDVQIGTMSALGRAGISGGVQFGLDVFCFQPRPDGRFPEAYRTAYSLLCACGN